MNSHLERALVKAGVFSLGSVEMDNPGDVAIVRYAAIASIGHGSDPSTQLLDLARQVEHFGTVCHRVAAQMRDESEDLAAAPEAEA